MNPQDAKIFFRSCGSARHQFVLWSRAFVNQIRVENVELVTLKKREVVGCIISNMYLDLHTQILGDRKMYSLNH